MKNIFIAYIIFLCFMNLLSFVLYAADKRRAKKGKWRIRESVLLCTGFFGGGAGALLSMKLWHHKTKHIYFYVVNISGLIIFLFILILLILKIY